MTTEELSNKFDLLYNQRSHAINMDEIDAYEKSLFLTQAQEEIFTQMYSKFDVDEFSKRVLNPLVTTLRVEFTSFDTDYTSIALNDFNSFKVTIPSDLAFITNEQLLLIDTGSVNVKPLKLDKYNILKDNPFRKPSDNMCWRSEFNFTDLNDSTNNKASDIEIITSIDISNIDSYVCSYLKYPDPIILVDLSNSNLSINGVSDTTEACLNNIIHEKIVELAVNIALKYLSNQNKQQ